MDVSFVILTWNSSDYIKRCINSYAGVLDREGLCAEFLIVDNGSQDNTVDVIKREIEPHLSAQTMVQIIQFDKNYGTTISRNIALRQAIGKYLIICDSDTEYHEGKLTDALDFLDANRDVGIIAPLLLWPDGEPQPTVRKFPTFFAKALKIVSILFNIHLKDYDFYPDFPWSNIQRVQTAASACWIFKRELIESVGYLDEKIFYSPEDLDYCYRMWKIGLKLIFFPEIKIYHHAQRLSRKNPFSRHALSHFGGLLYYFKKHRYIFRRVH